MFSRIRFFRFCQVLIISISLSSIFLSACGSKTQLPAAGAWQASAEFGTVDFIVNLDSSMITKAVFNFNKFQCGPGISDGSIELSYSQGLKISEGAINIELSNTLTSPVPPDPFNPIPMSSDVEVIKLTGNFSSDGKTASGDWIGKFNDATCSQGKWTANPIAATPITAFTPTETTETLIPNSLLGVWKADDMRSPDNSWSFSYSMYFQFTNTKQYVYHGVDTFNSNQPTDVSDIVYLNINDSTFIKKIINFPDHPEYLGKFQKWTWRFDNANILFTVYELMDSQDLALNNETITALATGSKVQQSPIEIITPVPAAVASTVAASRAPISSVIIVAFAILIVLGVLSWFLLRKVPPRKTPSVTKIETLSSAPIEEAKQPIVPSGKQETVNTVSAEISKSTTIDIPSPSQPIDPFAEFGYIFSGADTEVFNLVSSMTYNTKYIQQYESSKTFFDAMSMGVKLGLFAGSPDKACIVYDEKYPIGDKFKVMFTVNTKPPHTMVMCISRQTLHDLQKSDRCLGVIKEHFYILRI